MTKEKLEDRIKQLETEREQLKTTLIAYEGALQDCKYWLDELTRTQEASTKKEVDGGKSSPKSSK